MDLFWDDHVSRGMRWVTREPAHSRHLMHFLECGRHWAFHESYVKGMTIEHQKPSRTCSPASPHDLLHIWLQAPPLTFLEGSWMPALLIERYFQSWKPSHYWLVGWVSCSECTSTQFPKIHIQPGSDFPGPASHSSKMNSCLQTRKGTVSLPPYLHHLCPDSQERLAGTCPASRHSPVQSRYVKENKNVHLHSF